MNKDTIAESYQKIQDAICLSLEKADGKARFEEEIWNRDGGGGGRTRILQHGNVLEKGGVNFSAVYGKLPEAVKKSFGVTSDEFFATGVSIVIHPSHPLIPIIHMNIRYFEMDENTRWFGGGIDLTPHYIIDSDARYFHHQLKKICDTHHPDLYPKYKKHADDYFYIKHREETRGIGGIFYDRITPSNTPMSWEQIFAFSLDLGNHFAEIYAELMDRNRDKPFTPEQKEWQYMRRSRYAEFNLVYDAGTKFGLETNGRIESILMSLPPQANWVYDFKPKANSEEERTLSLLKKDIKWI